MFKRAKFYMIIFAIIFINFLTLDFLLIDVEKTALIVAIGVDKVDNEYEVTAQIAVPEASNQSTKSNVTPQRRLKINRLLRHSRSFVPPPLTLRRNFYFVPPPKKIAESHYEKGNARRGNPPV